MNGQAVVIDTNIVLDLYLFQDPLQVPLQQALVSGELVWLATPAMQQELAHVLARESMQQQAIKRGVALEAVMAAMAGQVRWAERAPVCPFRCKDSSDQGFVDLAHFHRALLISKDKAVVRLTHRMAKAGLGVGPTLALARQKCLLVPGASAG